MQYGRVLNLSFYNKAIQFIVKNRLLILVTVFFITGFAIAVFGTGKYEFVTEWTQNYFESFIAERTENSFFAVAADSFLSSMLFIILCLIFGTSMLGVIIIPAVVAVKGYILGNLTAYLYSVFSFEGVAFHAVIVLPPAIIFSAAFIFSAIEAINFSFNLSKLTFIQDFSFDLNREFKRFCFRFLLFSIPVLASGIIDALLSNNLLNNFSGIT